MLSTGTSPVVRSAFHGGAVPTPTIDAVASGDSFSFDLVFALLPTRTGTHSRAPGGGILLGAQSTPVQQRVGARQFKQYVRVDGSGDLRCSVVSNNPIVAESLAYERWYHIALVFDVTGPRSATQRVFLDGELVPMDGSMRSARSYPTHSSAQVAISFTGDLSES